HEPKSDGIRAIAELEPKGRVRLWSRLGNEKTNQFPEIAAALGAWARHRTAPLVLDGEIVALDEKGEPTGFQNLQGRIHLTTVADDTPGNGRVSFIAFDLLRDGTVDYRGRPLRERRAALERLFSKTGSRLLRLSRHVRGDARALYKEALERGWEGLIAKHAGSLYKSGKRTPDWRKIKIVHEQEFVVGGWTEPRQTRSYFGALLLGVYESRTPNRKSRIPNPESLVYVGHSGTGFNEKELARVMTLLKPLEIKECPFRSFPKTNERPHWVRPELVAQVRFTEWTADNKLRHPVYLGLRDDKKPADVRKEGPVGVQGSGFGVQGSRSRSSSRSRSNQNPNRNENRERRTLNPEPRTQASLIDQLSELEKARRDGVLELPDGDRLKVTNLWKVFWPKQKLTKGDLFRYYVRAAQYILPALTDRPLVMKLFPNGIDAPPFYQHRAEQMPAGVRTAVVSVVEKRPQIIGGDLKALLHMTQLAAISQDPWFSRIQHPQFADH